MKVTYCGSKWWHCRKLQQNSFIFYLYLFQIHSSDMSALHKVSVWSLCFIKRGTKLVSWLKVGTFTAPFSGATKSTGNGRVYSFHWKRVLIKQETVLFDRKQSLLLVMSSICDGHRFQYKENYSSTKFLLRRKNKSWELFSVLAECFFPLSPWSPRISSPKCLVWAAWALMKLVSKESVSSGLSVECNFCSDESHTLSPTFYQINLEFE